MITHFISKTKFLIKKLLAKCLTIIGFKLYKPSYRSWICHRIHPLLLDEKILQNQLIKRPLYKLPATILCNPYVYTHWIPYWCGRLHDYRLDEYLRHELKYGDTVIDVGSHVGQVTVLSACLVGEEGHVYSFEANKELANTIEQHCDKQGLRQVIVYPIGLGSREGKETFYINQRHLANSTFSPIVVQTKQKGSFLKTDKVIIQPGDSIFTPDKFSGRVFLKIDVEGYELETLKGLAKTLTYIDHAVIEVTPEWIKGNIGVALLFSFMHNHDFVAYNLNENGQIGARLNLESIKQQTNVLFIRKN